MKKNILKVLTGLSLSVCLTGCSYYEYYTGYNSPQRNYHRAKAASKLYVPSGLSRGNISDNYQIPAVRPPSGTVPPSILPPGGLYKPKNYRLAPRNEQVEANQPKLITLVEDRTGHPILRINATEKALWPDIGKALREADYKIVNQSKDLQTYYILYKKASKDRVTRKTPIYQIHLINQEQATNVVVTDNKTHPIQPGEAKEILVKIANALENKHAYPTAKWLKRIF
ncbi:MAG: outer membrane protein assembly factor BamC [Pseudomonadota bacterium]